MKITKSNNIVRSFYYTEDKGSAISDPLQRVYLSSGYGILGRTNSVNKGDLAVCWTQKKGKIFASLNRIEDPNFDTSSDIAYSMLWGSPQGSKYKTKAKVKELVKPRYIGDSSLVAKLGLRGHDNDPTVLKVCEELLKHI
jgi:hypothetical protein